MAAALSQAQAVGSRSPPCIKCKQLQFDLSFALNTHTHMSTESFKRLERSALKYQYQLPPGLMNGFMFMYLRFCCVCSVYKTAAQKGAPLCTRSGRDVRWGTGLARGALSGRQPVTFHPLEALCLPFPPGWTASVPDGRMALQSGGDSFIHCQFGLSTQSGVASSSLPIMSSFDMETMHTIKTVI